MQDYAEALKWYLLAADLGSAKAQNAIGLMYFLGKGVETSNKEAAIWFEKAALQGYAQSQKYLGKIYSSDIGDEQDYVAAYMWINLATLQGYYGAKIERSSIERKMSTSQVLEAQNRAKNFLASQ